MKNIKLTGEQLDKIKKIAKGGCRIVLAGLGTILYYNYKTDTNDKSYMVNVSEGYTKAINAIMASDMYDSYK